MMDLDLSGRTAFVSGSTAGIGFAIARGLAQEGASVTINGRTQDGVDVALRRLRDNPVSVRVNGIAADLGTAEGVAQVIEALPDVDILVNNVGIFAPKPFDKIPDADWLQFFQVNVMSGVRLTRHYLPGMRQRDWGRVVFVSSESAINIPQEMVHYGMTKAAQLAISRGAAETTAGTGVTVNAVLPGPTRSEGVVGFVEQIAQGQGIDAAQVETEFFKTQRPTSLIRRFASPEEVANMVVYICSPAASATNGAALRVDGGVVKSIV
jgi:NAD(P)-dependent dehydrogenase (short-subunit alcohol dehydrogenase family)